MHVQYDLVNLAAAEQTGGELPTAHDADATSILAPQTFRKARRILTDHGDAVP
jgi:hypothetical protein